MAKNSKSKLLFATLVLILLLVSSAYSTLVPNVNAAEITAQQKGLTILNEVVGLDVKNYDTALKEGLQDSYLGVVPQENIHYTLKSNGSSIEALYTFANGKLRMMNVLENEGSPRLTKSVTKPVQVGNKTVQVVDVPETAKVFLEDYQGYSGDSFYGDLASMLDDVDVNENVTKTAGNVKFEVTDCGVSKTYRWTYTFGGIDAPSKCVALSYKDGFLKYFIDNWNLYKIGSTTVNVSEEEAIDIAMERARTFSWNMGSENESVKISGFTVTNAMIWENVFCSNIYADEPRSGDPLMLYPVRHVWVSLDKFYPGNVYGFNVYVWADTGEVCAINERISTMDPPDDLAATTDDFTVESLIDSVSVDEVELNSLALRWIALPAFAAVALGIVSTWFLLSKKKNFSKQGSFKIGGILLCLLISSTMLLLPIPAVNAEETRSALIWGSESIGAYNDYFGFSWRKHPDEVYRQGVTSNAIYNYFKDDGYDAKNYQGDGSFATQILANISNSALTHSLVAVVDFDHGLGRIDSPNGTGEYHYMFEDQNGTVVGWGNENVTAPENGVYDMDIYSRTVAGKNFFAFINTCMSANVDEWQIEEPPGSGNEYQIGQGFEHTTYAQGMPFAWTHRIVDSVNPGNAINTAVNMSDDGYGDPDGGAFCYIGFPYGSAALNQTIAGVAPIYAQWLENFFWYALSFDISVNDALDEASLRNFDDLFSNTDLATVFTAVWPMYFDGSWHYSGPGVSGPGWLAVYGNGNIHLYEYFVHDYIEAKWYGDDAGVYNPDGIEGGSNDDSYTSLWAIGAQGDQAVVTGSIGWEATGHIYLYAKTYPSLNSHVYVYVTDDYDNWDPNPVADIWVSQTAWGWIDIGTVASDFRYIAVVVYADYAPSILYVDSVLVIPSPPQSEHYWVYSATEYEYANGHVYNVEYVNGSYHDGNTAHIGCPNPPDRADIIGTLNEEVVGGGHIEIYGCSLPGYYSDMYVYVSNDYSNWYSVANKTITATSPYWIDIGTYGSSFRYIRIVGYDSYNSVALNIDCVCIT